MLKRTGILMLAVAAVALTLANANDARAFFGRRGGSEGSSGSFGSSGGSGGSSGSYGGSSSGSHGGRFFRHRHSDSGGSHGGQGSYGESDSCGCSETAYNTEGNDQPQQASDRPGRGERYEAGYNSETRVNSNRQMPAPEYGERRGKNDRQARDRGIESREKGPTLNSDTKRDSDKPEPASDRSSDPKQQE